MNHQNILFITMDQFRADLLHGALAEFIDLPNIRALMRDATSFSNHWSVITPCGPSRASLLTGQYAMNHRSVRNGAPLDHTIPTMPSEMRKAGYTPLLFGYTDTSQDPRIHHANDPALQTYEMPMAGFQEVVEMRQKESLPWRAFLASKGYESRPYDQFYIPNGPDIDSPAFYAKEDSDTAFLTDQFLNFLTPSQPSWFAHLTYIRPHPPLVAPAPYNRIYKDRNIPAACPLPPEFRDHPMVREAQERLPISSFVNGFPDLTPSSETTHILRQIYFGLASEVDHHIGRIIQSLKSCGHYDNTLIILTADHGEMLGDYDFWGKSTIFDEAFKVPLIIRNPNTATQGQNIDAPTETVDIFPTLLEFAGLDIPSSIDGRSLSMLIDGKRPDDWRNYTWAELDFARVPSIHGVIPKQVFPVSKSNLSILREADLTLVHFNAEMPPFLFDHRGAGQAKNLANDPSYTNELLRLTRRMLDHRMSFSNQALSSYAITNNGAVRV